MADSLSRFSEDVRALRVSVDALAAEIRRVCAPAAEQVVEPVAGRADAFLDALKAMNRKQVLADGSRLSVDLDDPEAS